MLCYALMLTVFIIFVSFSLAVQQAFGVLSESIFLVYLLESVSPSVFSLDCQGLSSLSIFSP